MFYINSGHFSTKQENISVRPILSSELRLVKGRIMHPGTLFEATKYYQRIKSENDQSKWVSQK